MSHKSDHVYDLRHKQMHGHKRGTRPYDRGNCEHKQIGMDNKGKPDHIYDPGHHEHKQICKDNKGNQITYMIMDPNRCMN